MDDSHVTKVAPNGDRIDTTIPTRLPRIGAAKTIQQLEKLQNLMSHHQRDCNGNNSSAVMSMDSKDATKFRNNLHPKFSPN